MPPFARFAAVLRTLHWGRGLRAGFSVATAMVVCRVVHQPMGWAALGGFEAVLVDNGGPYRSRLNTIATVLFGGAFCGVIGTLAPSTQTTVGLVLAALITAAVCFAVTFARVAAQPIASTAVIILVIYFAGFGSSDRTLHAALSNVSAYILGGLWSAVLSLFFWPVDPFRPARLEVAGCYELLARFTAGIHAEPDFSPHPAHDDDHSQAVDFKRQLRLKLESAREALGATTARAPARTVRARNLSVLLETADMLFAATLRFTELAEIVPDPSSAAALSGTATWLSDAERTIAFNLKQKPSDNAASFGPNGSHRLEFVTRRAEALTARAPAKTTVAAYLEPDERDTLQNIAIAFEAVRAVWTGYEASLAGATPSGPPPEPTPEPGWFDAFRQNWTVDSVMMLHALRMAVIGAVDVLIMHAIHLSHGFWLAMTSIIVLQPYRSGTVRKSFQRVAGTVGGGVVAALLAAEIHSGAGIILVITVCSILTLATYAIDYGWYSFFLTPTFVLLSLPHPRDWRYAGIRIVTTMLGALVAVVAMRVLWPQSLDVELGRLLARSASASSAYVQAVLRFWQSPAPEKSSAERQVLAPARRACGLASQDAEEALDRLMLEPGLAGLGNSNAAEPAKDHALSFTTYIRRFAQCLTTLASVGAPTPDTVARLTAITHRLDALASALDGKPEAAAADWSASAPRPIGLNASLLSEQMLQRMERQTGVLERAAAELSPCVGAVDSLFVPATTR